MMDETVSLSSDSEKYLLRIFSLKIEQLVWPLVKLSYLNSWEFHGWCCNLWMDQLSLLTIGINYAFCEKSATTKVCLGSLMLFGALM